MNNCRIVTIDDLISEDTRYGCVFADPPWRFDNRASRGAAERHYRTMALEELAALPVRELVASDAHLHLWTPTAMLPGALELIDAWGFTFKSCFVWVKPELGLGNYWRMSHELMLLGTRGRLPFRDRSVKSWLLAARSTHSTKPDSIRSLIERVSVPPYLELFARRTVPGWTVLGDTIQHFLF